jgi:hypothetical protein
MPDRLGGSSPKDYFYSIKKGRHILTACPPFKNIKTKSNMEKNKWYSHREYCLLFNSQIN